jgi:hypothetical protein
LRFALEFGSKRLSGFFPELSDWVSKLYFPWKIDIFPRNRAEYFHFLSRATTQTSGGN